MIQTKLLNTSPEELADGLTSEFLVEVPILRNAETETSQEAVKIEVGNDSSRVMFDRSSPVSVDGTRFTYHIPFTGDGNLFKCRPSEYSLNPPRGKIVRDELRLIYEQIELKPEDLKSQFNRDLAAIQTHLDRIASDVNPFNNRLRDVALTKINQRREKLINDQNAVAELGFPVRRKE